jgi:hypothetical protein
MAIIPFLATVGGLGAYYLIQTVKHPELESLDARNLAKVPVAIRDNNDDQSNGQSGLKLAA